MFNHTFQVVTVSDFAPQTPKPRPSPGDRLVFSVIKVYGCSCQPLDQPHQLGFCYLVIVFQIFQRVHRLSGGFFLTRCSLGPFVASTEFCPQFCRQRVWTCSRLASNFSTKAKFTSSSRSNDHFQGFSRRFRHPGRCLLIGGSQFGFQVIR